MGKFSKSKKRYDTLVSRVLFMEFAFVSLAIGIFLLLRYLGSSLVISIIALALLSFSVFCLYICFVTDDKKMVRYAENTGNHEIMLVFIVAAYFIASIVRRIT